MNWKEMIVWLSALSLIAGVICFCVWQNHEVDRIALEQGYSQQTIPGKAGAYWVKGRPDGTTEIIEDPRELRTREQ
jgi:hypothetical protein